MLRVRDKNVSFCKDTGAYWLKRFHIKFYDKKLCELKLTLVCCLNWESVLSFMYIVENYAIIVIHNQ